MGRLVIMLGLVLVVAGLGGAARALESRTVAWAVDGVAYEGTLVFDKKLLKKARGKLPGVLVVHQWLGPTAHERARAERLAGLGYVAFVADIYGKDARPADMGQAGEIAGRMKGDRAELRRRALHNLATLVAQPEVDAQRTAAIGFCFGGTTVLELARAGADIDGVVSFHGGLDAPTPADGKAIKAKVLVLHGAVDPFVKQPDIAAFIAELEAAKVDYQKIDYAGAVHAFTQQEAGADPSHGVAYDERADRRSWEAMRDFLNEALAP